jgi:uncharacterized protein YdaU (DUF1376 family)
MKQCPFLTINLSDFRGETAGMTLAAQGAYINLMVYACYRGGMIPGDEAMLRRIVRASPPVWAQIKGQILPQLEPVEGGYVIHHAVTSAERHRSIVKSAQMGGLAKQQSLAARVSSNTANPLKTNDPNVPSAMPSAAIIDNSTPADGRDRDGWEDDPPF